MYNLYGTVVYIHVHISNSYIPHVHVYWKYMQSTYQVHEVYLESFIHSMYTLK